MIWVYLAATPLLGLTITLLAYIIAQRIYAACRFNLLANPMLIAIAIVVVLKTSETPYETYFDGTQFVHFLLGPATVALALPLYIVSCRICGGLRGRSSSVSRRVR